MRSRCPRLRLCFAPPPRVFVAQLPQWFEQLGPCEPADPHCKARQTITRDFRVSGQRFSPAAHQFDNPRGLVGLRGAGRTYDGLYYVKTVTHNISKGRYTQSFSLSREGTGTTTPFVLP